MSTNIKDVLFWIILAIIAGIIGNRFDYLFVDFFVKVKKIISVRKILKNLNLMLNILSENQYISSGIFENIIFPDIQYDNTSYNNIADILKNDFLHYEVVAAGGGGKTVALLYLLKYFRENYKKYKILPFFIKLNEINNFEYPINFILNYIYAHYLSISNEDIKNENFYNKIFAKLCKKLEKRDLKIYFLLDGYNEVTKGRDEMNVEIKKIAVNQNIKCII